MARRAASTAASVSSPLKLDDALRHVKFGQLLQGALVSTLVSSPALMTVGKAVVTAAVGTSEKTAPGWGWPVRAAVQSILFPYFCAGTSIKDVTRVSKDQCAAAAGNPVKLIVDYSTEEKLEAEARQANLRLRVTLLETISNELAGRVAFVPIKVTALVDPALLERVSADLAETAVLAEVMGQEEPPEVWFTDVLETYEERQQFHESLTMIYELGKAAQARGLSLLLDAEQSHQQPAIDLLARELMREFNAPGQPPVFYHTFQMYLSDADTRLAREIEHARNAGFVLAVKLVRGAYIESEAARARERGLPNPVRGSKTDTDEAYDGAVDSLLREVAHDRAALLVATHNLASVERAVATLAELGLARDHPGVHIAQIMGMSDRLTLAVAKGGFNAHKLVLFGDFHEIFPWMLRRLDENADMLSAMATERRFLWRELGRRMFNFSTSAEQPGGTTAAGSAAQVRKLSPDELAEIHREAETFLAAARARKAHAQLLAIKRSMHRQAK